MNEYRKTKKNGKNKQKPILHEFPEKKLTLFIKFIFT